MNLSSYSIKNNTLLQVVSSNWDKKIASHLPQDLDLLLKQSGCVKRFRGVSCAIDLLKAVFLYSVSGISFSMLSTAMHALSIASISDTAWKKRFSSFAPFLQLLCSNLLAEMVPTSSRKASSSRPVFFVDASVIRQQGKKQRQQRVHLSYSFSENRVNQIQVSDHHTAESLLHFSIKPGDIFLADAGYGTAKNYAYAREQKADVILRMTPSNLPIYNAEGKKIDPSAFLKEEGGEKEAIKERFGWIRYQEDWHFVRILATKLPEGKAKEARKRKLRKASKNQYKLREESLFYAGYMMLITSLGIEYGKEEIVHLYRSRWQIELLFKRWKQNLSIQTIRRGEEAYAKTIVYAWLLIWMLVEKQAILAEQYLYQKKESETLSISLWKLCRYHFIQVKELLCMSWSLFVELEIERQWKYLTLQKCQRINQNEEFHASILPSFIS